MKKIQILAALLAFMLVAAYAAPAVAPAVNSPSVFRAAQNLTPFDGIDEDTESGRHNSYAWCAELFDQGGQGEYLWVGTNRDLGASIVTTFSGTGPIAGELLEAMGIPARHDDNAGKIYRAKMNAYGVEEWELVYENPAINGYRKMLVFKDFLYVFGGLTNGGYNYSLVYRFGKDFKPGDAPDVVLWDIVTAAGNAGGYYRAATIYDDIMYVGTFDAKIFSTDGINLASLSPNNEGTGDKNTGWEQIASAADFTEPGAVWDIACFNGSLYAFLAGSYNMNRTTGEYTAGGFLVYKMNLNDFTAEQIVGGEGGASYPRGIGIDRHIAASPFVLTDPDTGKEYVYVTTFANGPVFLGIASLGSALMLSGNLTQGAALFRAAFEGIFCPANVYRFDENDTWEVIAGDRPAAGYVSSELVPVDTNGNPVPNVGNNRGGFFPGADSAANTSWNQYVWWMAEHEGKLYASTWDMGVFRDGFAQLIAYMLADSFGIEKMALVMGFVGAVTAIVESFDGGLRVIADEVTAEVNQLVTGFIADITAEGAVDMQQLTEQLIEDIRNALLDAASGIGLLDLLILRISLSGIEEVTGALLAAIDAGDFFTPVKSEAFSETISLLADLYPYLFNDNNPSGFDLFVSEDGEAFSPYMVSGFGDATNYGGRVLLSTSRGFYITTANPFNGCQVWSFDDIKPKLEVNSADSFEFKTDETVKFTVTSTAISSDGISVQVSGTDKVEATIKRVQTLATIVDFKPTVTRVFDPLAYGLYRYVETAEETIVPVYVYEITLSGSGDFDGDITVTAHFGDNKIEKQIRVKITKAPEKGFDWVLFGAIGGGAMVLGCAAIGVLYFVQKRKTGI